MSNLSALAGSVKGFVNYPGLICHHMMLTESVYSSGHNSMLSIVNTSNGFTHRDLL